MIISRTPYRISFFGGGTDYPEWFREQGGCVFSTTINRYCFFSCLEVLPFFVHNNPIVFFNLENLKNSVDNNNLEKSNEIIDFLFKNYI